MSNNSVPQECPLRVSFKEFPRRMSSKSVYKSVHRCQAKVSRKSIPQECQLRVSHKSIQQECPRRMSNKHLDINVLNLRLSIPVCGLHLVCSRGPKLRLKILLELTKACAGGLCCHKGFALASQGVGWFYQWLAEPPRLALYRLASWKRGMKNLRGAYRNLKKRKSWRPWLFGDGPLDRQR